MALGAGDRCPHPCRQCRVHTIDHGDIAEFFIAGAALVIRERVAMERGGDQLLIGWVRQQVAGNLFDRELIERLVGIERTNHIVAVRPDRACGVVGIPGGVRVACQIEPHSRPVFAVTRLRQQTIDELFVSVRRGIFDEVFDFFPGRRQTSQIERHSPCERIAIRFGQECQPLFLQFRE